LAYFRDSQEVYDTLGKMFQDVATDGELAPKLRKANTIVRYELRDPDSTITVRLQEGQPGDVDFGDSDMEPEVIMSMEADTAHRFWLGEVNVTVALARGPFVSAKREAESWAGTVKGLASERGLTYDVVGGINPVGGPVALCPGGTNRLTGELAPGFWGASCDADEELEGGLFGKAALPRAVLAKSHVPDLAKAMPPFNVESIEKRPEELVMQHASRRKVEFESIDFNNRFLATVPSEYDPVALRETFSPGFLEWVTSIDHEIEFGVSEQQLWFLWRLRERSGAELEAALEGGGGLFTRARKEVEEAGVHTYPAGPWHAGLKPFPDA
jgi:hypothetical protein